MRDIIPLLDLAATGGSRRTEDHVPFMHRMGMYIHTLNLAMYLAECSKALVDCSTPKESSHSSPRSALPKPTPKPKSPACACSVELCTQLNAFPLARIYRGYYRPSSPKSDTRYVSMYLIQPQVLTIGTLLGDEWVGLRSRARYRFRTVFGTSRQGG